MISKTCDDYVEDAFTALNKAILRCRYRGASQSLRDAKKSVLEAQRRMSSKNEPDQAPVLRDADFRNKGGFTAAELDAWAPGWREEAKESI